MLWQFVLFQAKRATETCEPVVCKMFAEFHRKRVLKFEANESPFRTQGPFRLLRTRTRRLAESGDSVAWCN